jgi:hypothetical protein
MNHELIVTFQANGLAPLHGDKCSAGYLFPNRPWSSGPSVPMRTCSRWQRMCSSSGISRLRLRDGRQASRLRGQFDKGIRAHQVTISIECLLAAHIVSQPPAQHPCVASSRRECETPSPPEDRTSTDRSPSPSLDITTTVTGLLLLAGLSPAEMAASLAARRSERTLRRRG